MKSAHESTNKEQENTYTKKSKRRNAQQHHSEHTKKMESKFWDPRKQHNYMFNGMSNMMYGFLYEVVNNRKK